MDLLEAKHRVAEALVESIFRRARYEVVPYRRAPAAGLRVGREDFSPDFRVRPSGPDGDRELLVEVKYHPSIEQFLSVDHQRGERSLLGMTRRQWPELYFVLVTDRPEPGRSCFQVCAVAEWSAAGPTRTRDLAQVEDLGIFAHNVADHEALARRIFALLSGG
jgi:hypothetical protein